MTSSTLAPRPGTTPRATKRRVKTPRPTTQRPSARTGSRRLRAVLAPTLAVVVILVGWELAVRVFHVEAWMLPGPIAIAREWVAESAGLWDDVVATTSLTLLGFAAGSLLGLAIAGVLHHVEPLKAALYPLLIISQNVPSIALAPLLVIWFGFGLTPKLVVIILVTFFPVAVAAMDGLRGADPMMRDYLRMSGATRSQIFWKLEVPWSLPSVFSGLKIAATYAVMGAVIGEWVGSDKGIGHYMLLQKSAFRADRVFVSICIIVVLSLTLFAVIALIERRVTRWRIRDR
ncbi:ABC-type nitrate/sulfonate/bicarbonate transport system, permease component [Sanguibacter gelidistatuariae]|uniref:ABC-type nitrate/sulfonate/bicarbonate transport system, permease component n=1 Tax=Sanguibacter gelidistatuariae TaxID=1814289 RepID=A0A1G6GVD8_9MICO|nr:ABC transporter permease [Sanguibacter gelidistatuariae]SDB85977.1 ABC-type nitrate/sulfonate/bicarbonate transport system, permease component [Sanguibacter gelidistatuariae]